MSAYQIVDEPKPSGLQHLVVNPIFPVFVFMFVGPYFSWFWSALNSKALGSPTFRKELIWIFAGVVLIVLNFFLWVFLQDTFFSEDQNELCRDLYLFSRVLVCLPVCYFIYFRQAMSFEIFRYFGGEAKNAVWVIIACFIFIERLNWLDIKIDKFLIGLFA